MPYDQYRPQTATSGAKVIDAGLQVFMRSVFNTMGFGLVVTGVTAYGVANIPALFDLVFGNRLVHLAAVFAPLIFLWLGFSPQKIQRMPAQKLKSSFIFFSVLMGLSMSAIFRVYDTVSIAQTFFITAATFAGMSLIGYTTKRDLSAMGSFFIMGVLGIFVASIVNLFMHSAALQFVISIIGVVAFTGLIAWDVQRLKETYAYAHGMEEGNAKLAVMGALSLYLNFINLFQFLLSLTGGSRD